MCASDGSEGAGGAVAKIFGPRDQVCVGSKAPNAGAVVVRHELWCT